MSSQSLTRKVKCRFCHKSFPLAVFHDHVTAVHHYNYQSGGEDPWENELEGERFVRRLRQQSANLMITLPRKVCRQLGWTSGNHLAVRMERGEVIISRVNLGAEGPMVNEHHRTPVGPHGDWIRKEQAAKAKERGE